MKFLHTADWQIGKPFESIEDPAKRERLRSARLESIRALRPLVEEHGAAFVVVCGDLFDSSLPDRATVSALCGAVGSLGVPVYSIPGNHDFGGPGSLWEEEFFRAERTSLAPDWQPLLAPRPHPLADAVLLPCPLLRRHEALDPTQWLRTVPEDLPDDLPRLVLAHGSTQGFSSEKDKNSADAANRIDLAHLPAGAYDYVALGDWHGTKQVADNPPAWYAGTPEPDRFPRGEDNRPGHVLLVETDGHGVPPRVTPISTARIGWHAPDPVSLQGPEDLKALAETLATLLGPRTDRDLLRLTLEGALGLAELDQLRDLLETYHARLLSLEVDQRVLPEPTEEELHSLTGGEDPLIARVARTLAEEAGTDPASRELLRELYLQVRAHSP